MTVFGDSIHNLEGPSPLKRSEDGRRFGRRANASKAHAIAQEHRQRNEAREPEDHRDRFHGEDGELVMRGGFGEAPWDDDQVEEGEDRPHGAEDEVVDLRGREGVPVA